MAGERARAAATVAAIDAVAGRACSTVQRTRSLSERPLLALPVAALCSTFRDGFGALCVFFLGAIGVAAAVFSRRALWGLAAALPLMRSRARADGTVGRAAHFRGVGARWVTRNQGHCRVPRFVVHCF